MPPPAGTTSPGPSGPERSTVSAVSAGGFERTGSGGLTTGVKLDWRQAARHHLWFVVGYNWLVALTIAPLAFAAAFVLSVVLPESVRNPWRPPPVAVLCVAGYVFFEVTSFCLERNWSHVSIWRFWRLAIPIGALQFFLCLKLARHDALGCLLFMALCLGCREFLFQFQAFFPAGAKCWHRDGGTQEKLTSAFLGGSAYGMGVALICGLGGTMVHAVVGDGRQVYSSLYIDVLIALALPLGRNITRMVLNQCLANATTAGPDLANAEQPKLDKLIMYGDVLFLLTLFIEVPFAFVFMLVPRTITFCLALALNVVVDVLFVQTLDIVQRREARALGNERLPTPRLSLSSQSGAKQDAGLELGVWSPAYCIERQESIFATLMGAAPVLEPSESTSLREPTADQPEDVDRSCGSCPPCRWLWPAEKPEGEEATKAKAGSDAVMSPRVSLLLDEHNNGVISCWAGRTELSRGSGHEVFLRQERKIAFTTHFLGSTLAVVIVTICIPVAKYAGDRHQTEFLGLRYISATELAIRAVAVLVLRIVADLLALRLLDLSAIGAPTLWESRHELSTFHGWFFRALAATCPLFAVIAATL